MVPCRLLLEFCGNASGRIAPSVCSTLTSSPTTSTHCLRFWTATQTDMSSVTILRDIRQLSTVGAHIQLPPGEFPISRGARTLKQISETPTVPQGPYRARDLRAVLSLNCETRKGAVCGPLAVVSNLPILREAVRQLLGYPAKMRILFGSVLLMAIMATGASAQPSVPHFRLALSFPILERSTRLRHYLRFRRVRRLTGFVLDIEMCRGLLRRPAIGPARRSR